MKITSEELSQKIESGETFVVDLYADWCGPCRMMSPVIESAAEKLKDEGSEVSIYKFNIEEDKEMASKLGVRSIPTIIAFSEGEKKITKVGLLNETQIINMANEILL